MVIDVFMVLAVIFFVKSSSFAITHNSAFRISLFFPRKIAVLFQLLKTRFFQQPMALTFSWSDFDSSTYITISV